VKQNATVDSSFWINSHRAGLTVHLLERFQVYYHTDVAGELREEFTSGREFWRLIRDGTLQEATLVQTQGAGRERIAAFGPGERAAINLAIEHPDWILLMDDRRPFLEAGRRGIQVLCSPVLVVDLYVKRKLTARQALEMLARLAALKTVSPDLLSVALAQLGAVLSTRRS